jgi:phenylalanine-4-hydroxylase
LEFLPNHLKKYVVEQNYDRYTPIDHAVWRFILRQLRVFLSTHAHESYLDGLRKTGIEIERIPKISDISQKLQEFGWRAIPVSGFIPPAAFMELQSLGVLPIASDMRSIEHLKYTPAPDIVHEAAGHAPLLVQADFARYLRQYAEVAKKAIISSEDLELYESIRILSDCKENPLSTPEQIQNAEKNLSQVVRSMSHVSEASELGRMNWWTAEYGLIGSLTSPKILGAGLLSSVGESKSCLSDAVKKIPLSIECVKMAYDITEPQPQLFVARDFNHLSEVLEAQAERMAFRLGGTQGLDRIIQAKTVNTVQLDSGIQISGVLKKYEIPRAPSTTPCYLQFQGPSQLSYANQELAGHSRAFHSDGFGCPIGLLHDEQKSISTWSESDWKKRGIDWQGEHLVGAPDRPLKLHFASGVVVEGSLVSRVVRDSKTLILTFKNCQVTYQTTVLFAPSWGNFDMAVGSRIPSVFGGPADRDAFGDFQDFAAALVPSPKYTQNQLNLHQIYQKVRNLREQPKSSDDPAVWSSDLEALADQAFVIAPNDWLIQLELFELCQKLTVKFADKFTAKLTERLGQFAVHRNEIKDLIEDGIRLAKSC